MNQQDCFQHLYLKQCLCVLFALTLFSASLPKTMFVCPVCSKFEGSHLGHLLSHIGVKHSSDLQFFITCGLDNCPQTYSDFGSFRSHVYRKHRNLMHEPGQTVSDGSISHSMQCPFCSDILGNLAKVSTHFRTHLTDHSPIECPYKDCESAYAEYNSWTSHVCRVHPFPSINDLKDYWIQDKADTDPESHDTDDGVGSEVPHHTAAADETVLFDNYDAQFQKHYAHFVFQDARRTQSWFQSALFRASWRTLGCCLKWLVCNRSMKSCTSCQNMTCLLRLSLKSVMHLRMDCLQQQPASLALTGKGWSFIRNTLIILNQKHMFWVEMTRASQGHFSMCQFLKVWGFC